MKFTLLSTLGLASLAVSAPSSLDARQSSLQTVTDNYLFSISIGQFISNRNAQAGPAGLDWSSDGCSSSPDNPFGFDFTHSCYRHDFGYRNYKKQNRFTDAGKARIDNNFKSDMYNQCATEKYKGPCEVTANLYYEAVKAFGKKRAAEVLEARMALEQEEARKLKE